MSYLHGRGNAVASAKDIAAQFNIPPAILAKVMQALKQAALVRSVKGTSGGYALACDLDSITFLSFIKVFGEDTSLVDCLGHSDSDCQQADGCEIRDPIATLNGIIQEQLAAITLATLLGTPRSLVPLSAIGPVV